MIFELDDLNKMTKASLPEAMKNYNVVFDADSNVNAEIIRALVKGIGDIRTRMKLIRWGMANDMADSKIVVEKAMLT